MIAKALSAMASVTSDLHSTLKALLYAVCMILAGIVGWALIDGIMADREHSERIVALESTYAASLREISRRLEAIENELRGR